MHKFGGMSARDRTWHLSAYSLKMVDPMSRASTVPSAVCQTCSPRASLLAAWRTASLFFMQIPSCYCQMSPGQLPGVGVVPVAV